MDPGAVLDNVSIIFPVIIDFSKETHNLVTCLFCERERSFMLVHTHMSISTTYFLVWQQKCLKNHSDFWWVFDSGTILRYQNQNASCVYVCMGNCFQIVDSVIALFRVDFTGRGELADRQVYHDSLTSLHCLRIWYFSSSQPSALKWTTWYCSKNWDKCCLDWQR